MFWQANHLGTLICTFFDEAGTLFEIPVHIFRGAELDNADDGAEIVLLG